MPDWKPRKRPRQERAQATVEAVLEGCARVLRKRGWSGATTNAIAREAGVAVGSLYEYFPNREAVVVELARRRLAALAEATQASLAHARSLDAAGATRFVIRSIAGAVAADRALFRALLRESPALARVPELRRALTGLLSIGRLAADRARNRVALPHPEADAWLLNRMLAHAVLEIAFLDDRTLDRDRLVDELARLTYRMLRARDIDA